MEECLAVTFADKWGLRQKILASEAIADVPLESKSPTALEVDQYHKMMMLDVGIGSSPDLSNPMGTARYVSQ